MLVHYWTNWSHGLRRKQELLYAHGSLLYHRVRKDAIKIAHDNNTQGSYDRSYNFQIGVIVKI